MGLRQRIILSITIPALLGMGVHGTIRGVQERAQVIDEEKQRLMRTARAVQIAVENALRDRQFSDVQRLVSEMVDEQEAIDGIRLFDRDLAVTFVSSPGAIGKAVPSEALRRVMESGGAEPRYERRDTQSVVSVLAPLSGRTGKVDGAIEIVRVAVGLDRQQQAAIADVLIRLGMLLVATIGLTGFVLQRQVLYPLARLTEGIQRLGRGEATAELPVDRGDELGKVAQEFNRMAARLTEARRQLVAETERALELEQGARQAATLAVAGKLAAGLAHEVGTPLNIISGRAEFTLRAMAPDDPSRDDIEAIIKQIDRISRVITGLLDVVRPESPKLEPLTVSDVVDELLPLLRHAARQRGISLESSVGHDGARVSGDAGQLQQVLMNLVVNAFEATPTGGRVTTITQSAVRDGRPGVALSVTDTGAGIEPEVMGRIFEAFFTTKSRGQGTGLGLAICRDIAKAHGGELTAESRPGEGATFTLWLPAEGTSA
jgi:two-component system, NtrC family, sensor kinase